MVGLGRTLDRPALLRAGGYAWAVLGLVGAAVLLWLALSRVAIVTVPLLLALFPAAVLAPTVTWLTDHKVPRALASLLVLLGLLVVGSGLVAAVVPFFVAQLPALVDEIARAVEQLRPIAQRLPGVGPDTSLGGLVQRLFGANITGMTLAVTRNLLYVLSELLLLLVALFFYLYQGDRFAGWGLNLVPRRRRASVTELVTDVWQRLGRFLRALLVVAFIDAVLIGSGLALLGVPLTFPLAVLVFFGAFLPFIGATLSGLIAILVALADGGPWLALAVLALVVVVQLVEGNVIGPRVVGHVVRLPAFGVIVAIVAGGALFGVLGAFLAVPLTAVLSRAASVLQERGEGAAGQQDVTAPGH